MTSQISRHRQKSHASAKSWNERIRADPMATVSQDGWTILCAACLGQGRNKGIVKMRHPYALSAWDEHCRGKRHSDAAANIAAEKEQDVLRNKKQKAMANFFPVKKRTKTKDAVDTSATRKQPAIDLTASPDKVHAVDVVDLTAAHSMPVE